ncbi:MAG: pseudaminic acid synthase [Chthoniobacter sp.]|nr:pseudaminic acid synthase [Chthoniobacter sp.]
MIPLQIRGKTVGPGCPTYVIAEVSANHQGSYEQAVRIIEAAHEAGADAVKLQTYTPDTLTIKSDGPHFRIGEGTLWAGRTLYELYGEAFTPWDWQPRLKDVAEGLGLDLFSTPFDFIAVEFLEKMQVPVWKIASFELVDLPLIERCAATGKPLIMSTGMATHEEIGEAVAAARRGGATQIALLKCTSGYPAAPEEMNLRTIPDMVQAFDVPIGLSDHTLDLAVPVAAVALGACIIEKHLTLHRADGGPDGAFSLEPAEFRAMVEQVRITERALGGVNYEVSEKESASRIFRRSLFTVADVKAGEAFTAANVRSIRPGNGLHTRHLAEVLTRKAACDVARGTPLSWDIISKA